MLQTALLAGGYLDPEAGEAAMSAENPLDRFLSTDPRDGGCAETVALRHVYVELTLAGRDPESRDPRIAAHLPVCEPLAAVRTH